jgi:hypothetical protein
MMPLTSISASPRTRRIPTENGSSDHSMQTPISTKVQLEHVLQTEAIVGLKAFRGFPENKFLGFMRRNTE